MKKRNKILIISGACITALALSAFGAVYFTLLHHYKGKKVVDEWSETDIFDINKVQTLAKEKDKDFIIMNLADIQICDLEDGPKVRKEIHNQITEMVEKYKPNLITLSGDQTWSNENLISLKAIISWLDGYKIPYAPIFGNHDYGNEYNSSVASINKCCDLYEQGKYSLFKRGPTNLGTIGNYVLKMRSSWGF